jgi:hypothetical protein
MKKMVNLPDVSGDSAPELLPVVVPGFDLSLVPPQRPVVEPTEDLLADSLFGDVIDISDLIPRLSSPSAEVCSPEILLAETAGTAELMLADGGDALAMGHAAALTILYDDAILDLDKTTL